MPKLAGFASPRILLISWRPAAGKPYSDVQAWLERFTNRMSYECPDDIKLIDIRAVGENTADQRPGSWTDFLAVWTIDYALACRNEAKRPESTELLRFLEHIGDASKHGWVAKLETRFKRDFAIADYQPWADASRWHELPEDSKSVFPMAPGKEIELDDLIALGVVRIKNHPLQLAARNAAAAPAPADCGAPEPAQTPDTPPRSGFGFLRRLLGRDH